MKVRRWRAKLRGRSVTNPRVSGEWDRMRSTEVTQMIITLLLSSKVYYQIIDKKTHYFQYKNFREITPIAP